MKKQKNTAMNNSFAMLTLGCCKNTVDSERITRALEENGFTHCDSPENSEILIINTCGFINDAKEESIRAILEASEMKKRGMIRKVVVTGCLSERYGRELAGQIKNIDCFFGVNSEESVVRALKGDDRIVLNGGRHLFTPGHYAYLKISEGCNHRCAFCAIPLIRGNYVSRSPESLLEESKMLVDSGVKEINIIAQDTTYYGKDIWGQSRLAELMAKISDIGGLEWLRLMYTYPVGFPMEVADVMAERDNICNYIDIPLQHISDPVLKEMGRGISGDKIRSLVDELRKKVPGIAIRSTFITGFPNETERDFEELLEFINEYKLDRVGAFQYSREDGTSAFYLGDKVPDDVKAERARELMLAQQAISLEKNQKLVNTEIEVLIDEFDQDLYRGRTRSDAPEVDNGVIIPEDSAVAVGNIYKAKVIHAEEYDLICEKI